MKGANSADFPPFPIVYSNSDPSEIGWDRTAAPWGAQAPVTLPGRQFIGRNRFERARSFRRGAMCGLATSRWFAQ